MFTTQRDMSVVRHLNRELLGNIITQQCAIYQFKLEETKVNLYGEAAEEKFYDGPFLFNVLINRSNEEFGENEEGVQYSQPIEFYFLRDDLTEKKVDLEVGDIFRVNPAPQNFFGENYLNVYFMVTQTTRTLGKFSISGYQII